MFMSGTPSINVSEQENRKGGTGTEGKKTFHVRTKQYEKGM
jgi:hypothetical protein